jgi:hypothetical protein
MKLIMVLCVFLLAAIVHAQHQKTVEVTGKGYPQDEAYNDARERAVRQAGTRIITAFGELQTGSKSEHFVSRSSFVSYMASALIVSEDTLQRARLLPGEVTDQKPLYEVRLRITVRASLPADPYFQLRVAVDPPRTVYRDGESVAIKLEPTQDCYVTIFNLASDNRLWQVYPNLVVPNNYLPKHKMTTITGLEMRLLPGQVQSNEVLIAIATKGPFPFLDLNDTNSWTVETTREGRYVAMVSRGAATRLAEWLSQLGDDQWTMSRISFNIIK